MKTGRIAVGLLILCAPLAIAHAQNTPPSQAPPGQATIIQAENRFALTLFQRLVSTPAMHGNLVLAPSSLYTILTMSLVGARGKTAAEIANTLNAPNNGPHCHLGHRQRQPARRRVKRQPPRQPAEIALRVTHRQCLLGLSA